MLPVAGGLFGVEVAFDYADSLDRSWSSDYYAIIVDPSGDIFNLGDGLGAGDIDYTAGLATGADGVQVDATDGGSYGITFNLERLARLVQI